LLIINALIVEKRANSTS